MLSDQQLLELAALSQSRRKPNQAPPLMQWIPQVSPGLDPPEHLAPIVAALEQIRTERIELAFSVPPRHFKSWTVLHAVVWLLKIDPTLRILYATFNSDQAADQVAECRRIAERAGIQFGDINQAKRWTTQAGGLFRGVGLNTTVNGSGFHLVIVDDPHAGRKEAESRTIRNGVVERFFNDVYSRQLPARPGFPGTSFLVVHTRWHPDDLIGIISRPAENFTPFQYINLPAINAAGEALAPKHWPVERLANFKRNQRTWWSLYQGRPQPAGGAVFEGSYLYEPHEVPTGLRYAVGVDLAYSATKSADFSVALVAARGSDGRVYIIDVARKQCRAREFANVLLDLQRQYPGAPMRWYTGGGGEAGVADLLRDLGATRLVATPTREEKRVRALPVASEWELGRVVIPRNADWADEFIEEVLAFTGQGDAHDDQVDALAAAFDALEQGGLTLAAPGRSTDKVTPWGATSNAYGGRRARPW